MLSRAIGCRPLAVKRVNFQDKSWYALHFQL